MDLYYGLDNLRNNYGREDYVQDAAGPGSHRQFVRETVFDNPFTGMSVAAFSPAYTAAKAANQYGVLAPYPQYERLNELLKKYAGGRSAASMDEIFSSYDGLIEGMSDWYHSKPLYDDLLEWATK